MHNILRMKDLEQLSGERKSTILYYIREGLLPEPQKATQNSAVYDESYVDKIKKIRALQQMYNLPLKGIKEIIQQGWDKVDERIECKRIFLDDFAGSNKYSFQELVAKTGIKPVDLKKLIDLELVLPMGDNHFNEEDKAIVQLFLEHYIHTFPLDQLRFYPKLFRKIAQEEMAYRNTVTNDLSCQEQLDLSMILYKTATHMRYYQGKRMLDRLIRDL